MKKFIGLNLSKIGKDLMNNKKLFALLLVMMSFMTCMFAGEQEYDFGMNGVMTVIVKFLTSNWIIGIVIALLAFEIILFITAGRSDNQAWKKFVPIILGTGLFLAAPKITNYFINGEALGKTLGNAEKLMNGEKLQ